MSFDDFRENKILAKISEFTDSNQNFDLWHGCIRQHQDSLEAFVDMPYIPKCRMLTH